MGFEASNDINCEGRDIPWLQETGDQDVWGDWEVTYRDVIIVDVHGAVFDVYNLTSNSLADEANRDGLKALLRDAAAAP